jgi:hypothetical protein
MSSLCSICSSIAGKHGLRTVERVLEKLDEYQDKADRSLLIDVPIGFFFSAIPEPERYSQPDAEIR